MTEWNEGWHQGKAIDYAIGVTDGGTESINILLQANEEDPSGDGGKIITTQLWCTEKAIANTVEALRIFGWTGIDLSDFESPTLIPAEELLPNEVSFPINNEEYNGKTYAKVGKICRASSSRVYVKNRLEGTAAKEFGARFRAACAAIPGAVPAQKRQEKAPAKKPPARQADMTDHANEDSPEGSVCPNDGFPF
jgi:hypothetical protein